MPMEFHNEPQSPEGRSSPGDKKVATPFTSSRREFLGLAAQLAAALGLAPHCTVASLTQIPEKVLDSGVVNLLAESLSKEGQCRRIFTNTLFEALEVSVSRITQLANTPGAAVAKAMSERMSYEAVLMFTQNVFVDDLPIKPLKKEELSALEKFNPTRDIARAVLNNPKLESLVTNECRSFNNLSNDAFTRLPTEKKEELVHGMLTRLKSSFEAFIRSQSKSQAVLSNLRTVYPESTAIREVTILLEKGPEAIAADISFGRKLRYWQLRDSHHTQILSYGKSPYLDELRAMERDLSAEHAEFTSVDTDSTARIEKLKLNLAEERFAARVWSSEGCFDGPGRRNS